MTAVTVTVDIRPRGLELVAIRVGATLVRWGRESAERRAQLADPGPAAGMRAESDALHARYDAMINHFR